MPIISNKKPLVSAGARGYVIIALITAVLVVPTIFLVNYLVKPNSGGGGGDIHIITPIGGGNITTTTSSSSSATSSSSSTTSSSSTATSSSSSTSSSTTSSSSSTTSSSTTTTTSTPPEIEYNILVIKYDSFSSSDGYSDAVVNGFYLEDSNHNALIYSPTSNTIIDPSSLIMLYMSYSLLESYNNEKYLVNLTSDTDYVFKVPSTFQNISAFRILWTEDNGHWGWFWNHFNEIERMGYNATDYLFNINTGINNIFEIGAISVTINNDQPDIIVNGLTHYLYSFPYNILSWAYPVIVNPTLATILVIKNLDTVYDIRGFFIENSSGFGYAYTSYASSATTLYGIYAEISGSYPTPVMTYNTNYTFILDDNIGMITKFQLFTSLAGVPSGIYDEYDGFTNDADGNFITIIPNQQNVFVTDSLDYLAEGKTLVNDTKIYSPQDGVFPLDISLTNPLLHMIDGFNLLVPVAIITISTIILTMRRKKFI